MPNSAFDPPYRHNCWHFKCLAVSRVEGVQMLSGKRLVFVLIALVALALPSRAQTGKGTISGTVEDSGDSALQGALVELLPLGRQGGTDGHGQFRLTAAPAGEYTVRVSYVREAVATGRTTVPSG